MTTSATENFLSLSGFQIERILLLRYEDLPAPPHAFIYTIHHYTIVYTPPSKTTPGLCGNVELLDPSPSQLNLSVIEWKRRMGLAGQTSLCS